MKILISSKNPDKIQEIRNIFRLPGVKLITLEQFPDAPAVTENGNTLYDNALKKASMLCDYTGLPTLSDDTGLEVDALNGAPGVYSARFAGENASYAENVAKMIRLIKSVPQENRSARFRTVALFYHPDRIIHTEGSIDGVILSERRGHRGFGYDPIFYVPQMGKTFAEMDPSEKNAISHRAKAFIQLYKALQKQLPSLRFKF
jgi:XTP/dITP diphosphohydrolase